MVTGVRVPRAVAVELMAHARGELPNEACGLLAGSLAAGRANSYHRARNADASPLRYSVHPEDLVRMMYAKEEGVPVDLRALGTRIRSAVEEIVHKQAGAGVDIVNDGEMSKPGYATYVKDRLDGFGGTGNTFVYQDLV